MARIKHAKNTTLVAVDYLNKLISGRTGCFNKDVIGIGVPGLDDATIKLVEEHVAHYIKSWILPKLDVVIEDLG